MLDMLEMPMTSVHNETPIFDGLNEKYDYQSLIHWTAPAFVWGQQRSASWFNRQTSITNATVQPLSERKTA